MHRHGAFLTIDLAAIQRNYRTLRQMHQGQHCGAVVKADAYGLGLRRVGRALAAAGARYFFVAQLNEAITLRETLSPNHGDVRIYDFAGVLPGAEEDYLAYDIRPVLNSFADIERWARLGAKTRRRLSAALHLDSGMNRLGLPADELDRLVEDLSHIETLSIDFVMSHLACADQSDHHQNEEQLSSFERARARLPDLPASFANSAGVLLGPAYHFHLARPGIGLYGGAPVTDMPNPLVPVVQLEGRILQVREIDAHQSVGYGAAFRASGPIRVATVALGYADGYLRFLSNQGVGYIDGMPVPIVGRVSMDLLTFDVTRVPAARTRPGMLIELLGASQGIDDIAEHAGTIAHEILTSLGQRYHRSYIGD